MMCSKRQVSSSSSATVETGHNEELMTQISVNLPVQSILCFRSVSKQWLSLLTHPMFIKQYASHTRRTSMLFFQRINDIHSIDSLPLNGNNHNLDVADFGYVQNQSDHDHTFLVQSCNGLLLFDSRYGLGGVRPRINKFYVSNHFTKKCCELEIPDYIRSAEGFLIAYLSFDPRISPYYKVIFLWNEYIFARDYYISIYSSETKTCKNLYYTFEDYDPIHSESGVYFNGAIIWSDFHLKTSSYFDINQESIKKVPKNPPYSGPDKDLKYFGRYRDHLHLILGYETDPVLDVYELKEDFSSWVVKYKIDIESIAVEFPEISRDNAEREKRYKYSLLSVLEKEEEPTVVLHAGHRLLAYNLIDKTTKKLYYLPTRGYGCELYHWSSTFHCMESLSSV